MKRTIVAAFLFLIFNSSFSQIKTVDVDKASVDLNTTFYTVEGTPFLNTKFVRLVEGSPYFRTEWCPGSVLLKNNKAAIPAKIKLDLFDNEVHYLDNNNNEIVLTAVVQKVMVNDLGTEYTFHHASTLYSGSVPPKTTWHLKLYEDSVTLYKYFEKRLVERKPYNSATYEQTIQTYDRYWVSCNGKQVLIKKLKDAPALFGDQKMALELFLKNEDDKSASMDDRMIAFIKHLNALLKK